MYNNFRLLKKTKKTKRERNRKKLFAYCQEYLLRNFEFLNDFIFMKLLFVRTFKNRVCGSKVKE